MAPYQIVEFIMIGFAVTYVIVEIVLNYNDIDKDTSNIILLKWSQGSAFFIPFALGAIGGHLFLGTKNTFFLMPYWIPVVVLFGVAIVMLIIGLNVPFKKGKGFLFSMLLLGLAYGHFIWSMNIPSIQP